MENVRVESLLGNKKVIVGNPYSDIVLETLGKVYIKSGRNCKLLDDVIKELAVISEAPKEEVYAKTIIVSSIDELESLNYPGDGYLIYNSLNKSLYISYEDKYIALIESVSDTSEDYVKKSGDSMSGQLEITVDAFPPLIVHSKKLVSNFNANYLEGYSAKDLAKKKEDEVISGDWVFTGSNISKANWRFYRDIIVDGSISSPFFSSGFSGSGWRIDATTNTLTIDYLVVRKAMQVYEMVVNKITATNGSLWVSNASKVENFVLAYENTTTEFMNEFKEAYSVATNGGTFTELNDTARSLLASLLSQRTDIIFTDQNVYAYSVGNTSWQCPTILTHIQDAEALVKSSLFTEIGCLWNKAFLDSINIEDPTSLEAQKINNSAQAINLFAESGPESYMDIVSSDNLSIIKKALYYEYFYGTENTYVVDFNKDEYPVFKPGDIVRCQKIDNQNIKYYDAIVLAQVGLYSFAIQLAKSVFDKYTEVTYDEKGNVSELIEKYNDNLYNRTDWTPSDDDIDWEGGSTTEDDKKLAQVEVGDDIVQVGNIKSDSGRQNAIYLTSTDDQGPYINILSDLNRPDYSVLYKVPILNEDGTYKTKVNESGQIEYLFEYTKTTKVRVGNLGGIVDYTFPSDRQPRGYGLYGQNVYLTGNFYLNNGKSVIDASEEGVILKYKEAGLSIIDDPNDPTGEKTVISINADLVRIGDGKSDLGTLFYMENGRAYIRTDFIKAQKIEVEEVYNYSYSDTSEYGNVSHDLFVKRNYSGDLIPYSLAMDDTWVFTESASSSFSLSSIKPSLYGFTASLAANDYLYVLSPTIDISKNKLKEFAIAVKLNDGEDITKSQYYDVVFYDIENSTSLSLTKEQGTSDNINIYKYTPDSDKTMTGKFRIVLIVHSDTAQTIEFTYINPTYQYYKGTLMWGLFKDGHGSLAKEKIYWTEEGELTINGDFRSTNGQTTILMGNNSKSAYLSIFSNNAEEHPLLYMRYRNVGSGNAVSIDLDSEYTHDDIYYSRARLTCEGLTFGYTQKGYLDTIIQSGLGYRYIALDKYNGFTHSTETSSFVMGENVRGLSIYMGGKAFTIRPDGGGICFNWGAYPGVGGHAWPTSIDQVSVGGVYIHTSDGSLHVKQS